MAKLLPVILITAVLLAGMVHFAGRTQRNPSISVQVKEAYSIWCKQFGKLRASPEEHNFRLKNFHKAFEFVQRHNANPKKSHTVALNQFADLTDEEFMSNYGKKFTGSLDQGMPEDHVEPATNVLGQTPENVDLRNTLQQESMQSSNTCNDNYAWVAAVNMNANYFISRGGAIRYQFSPQTYIDCTGNFGNHGCNGGQAYNSFEYSKNYGVATLSDYPYFGSLRGCRAPTGMFRNLRTTTPPQNSNSALKSYLMSRRGVVSVGLDMTSNEARFYNGGIFKGPCTTNPSQNLLLVGMGIDPLTQEKFWLIMNTWGTFWGEKGVMRIARFEVDGDSRYSSCGLNMWSSYPEF